MTDDAEKILAFVKENGKCSGGTIKDALSLKDSEYRKAKDELSTAGVVTLGRGRGGTMEAIDGATPPPEPKKLSKAEIMAGAREEKEAKSKVQKFHQKIKEYGRQVADKNFPDNKTEVHIIKADINNLWGEFHIWVWGYDGDDKKAKPFGGFYDGE
jgi:hypothetical protein